ncbi:hypothetical protein V1478_007089 [Vespula squamosa]|uniref:Uncharacterized protein n=1 Tax=Vespula squamosa TaxID=30214 RepID=A0ABD2B290_VESSQ
MFSWMNSCNKEISSLLNHENSNISEFSTSAEINQDESVKKVLRSALKKPKSNDDLENIEKTPKKVTFLLDEKYVKKHKKKSKLSKRFPPKPVFIDGEESDSLTEINSDECCINACKRKIHTLHSRNRKKLPSPPISSYPSFESLEFLNDDTKIKEFNFSEKSKEDSTILNNLFKFSSKKNKIVEYIYKKMKALTKPYSRGSQNEASQRSEDTDVKSLINDSADNHNDDHTSLDDGFINQIEHDTSENPANTTAESTVGKILFGVNLNYQKTLDDMYDVFQKEKPSCANSSI